MVKYLVSVRGSKSGYDFECSEYQEAWDLYHFFIENMATDVCIDLVDCDTGEVIESNTDFE